MIRVTVIIFLVLVGHLACAQFTYIPQTINTPYGNVHYQQRIYTPMNYGYVTQVNPKFDFTIILASDSVINLRSRVEVEDKKMYLLQKDKKTNLPECL